MAMTGERTTQPLGTLVQPGFARLTVVGGAAPAGLSFGVSSDSMTVGLAGCEIDLTGDARVSARHATIAYEDGRLVVRDEGSVNGVWHAIREPADLAVGAIFRLGDQVYRVDAMNDDRDYTWQDGTKLLTSPRRTGTFRVIQLLEGGRAGYSASAVDDVVTIGGQGSRLAMLGEPHISARHATVTRHGDVFRLEDHGSVNGTYVRVDGVQVLADGDLLWVGGTLFRVDIV